VAWSGFLDMRRHMERFRDTHYTVFCTSEETCVRLFRVRDQLNLGHGADRVGPLHSAHWHAVSNGVVGQIHILIHDFLQSIANEKLLSSRVH